jgi:hypothetical protein
VLASHGGLDQGRKSGLAPGACSGRV